MTRAFRTSFLCIGLLCAGLATPVLAGQVEDSIVRQLREQGFSRIEVSRTLLGRMRIVAMSTELEREIIVDPRTGEILRDYWVKAGDQRPGGLLDPIGGGDDAGSGNTGDGGDDGSDNDTDDDHDDDDDGDDGDGDDGDDDD